MTYEQFTDSLAGNRPPEELSAYLRALWYDGKEDWKNAHTIAQDITDTTGSWIHAYLHRKEGDTANASYWYRKAKKPMPGYPLRQEWEEIVRANL